MTEFEYRLRARIRQLEEARASISWQSDFRLTYVRNDSGIEVVSEILDVISNILRRHDALIRKDIDDELNNLRIYLSAMIVK